MEHFISVVSSRCPCLRGPRFILTQVTFQWLLLAFDHLFEFFVLFFSFPLSSKLVTYVCVLSMH
jgi:hypothetical protein